MCFLGCSHFLFVVFSILVMWAFWLGLVRVFFGFSKVSVWRVGSKPTGVWSFVGGFEGV